MQTYAYTAPQVTATCAALNGDANIRFWSDRLLSTCEYTWQRDDAVVGLTASIYSALGQRAVVVMERPRKNSIVRIGGWSYSIAHIARGVCNGWEHAA
jgi:hypothetical protein